MINSLEYVRAPPAAASLASGPEFFRRIQRRDRGAAATGQDGHGLNQEDHSAPRHGRHHANQLTGHVTEPTLTATGVYRHARQSPEGGGREDGLEPELAHPLQGQHDIGDLMFRVVTERVERLVNSFRRDRRLPEKGPETGGGRNTKLAIAGRREHDVIRTARSSNPDAADSVSHRTSPPGILLREHGCPWSTGIPRAPRASGLHDPPHDKADQHKDGSEQDERERVGPVVRGHRDTRVRRAMGHS